MTELLALLNQTLQQARYQGQPAELYQPIAYMMELGGKRIRPLLTLLGADLFGDAQKALQPALGVEVFHNFTLLHDDIMDQAPLRRGQQTVHQKWNPNIAILSGDVMLVKAYEHLMQVDDSLMRTVLELFNTCAAQVCEGQQLDMNFETRNAVTIEEYLHMIRLKTAVLLGFSLQLGALIGGAAKEQATLLCHFATNIGIAFQLQDDLLDVYADKAKFGKQVGGDILSNKKTFLLLTALASANTEQRNELQHWLHTSNQPEQKVEAVTALYNALDVKQTTLHKMQHYEQLALSYLHQVNAPSAKLQHLQQLAHDLMHRDT